MLYYIILYYTTYSISNYNILQEWRPAASCSARPPASPSTPRPCSGGTSGPGTTVDLLLY